MLTLPSKANDYFLCALSLPLLFSHFYAGEWQLLALLALLTFGKFSSHFASFRFISFCGQLSPASSTATSYFFGELPGGRHSRREGYAGSRLANSLIAGCVYSLIKINKPNTAKSRERDGGAEQDGRSRWQLPVARP